MAAVPSPIWFWRLTFQAENCPRSELVNMLEGKAVVGDTDMTDKMQVHAMRCASEALDLHDVTDCKDIACYIKKVISTSNLRPHFSKEDRC